MARKTKVVHITDRGTPKTFLITEASATDAEEWAIRAFLAMADAGVEIPDDIESLGFAGVASVGMKALGKIPYEAAKPLLDRLMGCVQIMPDPNDPRVVRSLIEDDIEDVATRLALRKEVFRLHVDFLTASAP